MSFVQDTTYIPTSYSYGDQHKDFYEPPLAVLPYGFQQPQHGHLYPGTIGQQLQVHGSQLKIQSLDHYQQPLPIQSSGFYYTAAAGPSVISHNDALNGTNVEPEHTVQSLDHYQQPHSIQSSGFYYTTTAGPSVISHGDTPHAPTVVPEQAVHSEEDASTSSGPSGKKRGTKRGRPTKNPVWTFFHRVDDKSVQCNMCARLVKSACATNMSKHLERHHQNIIPTSVIDAEYGVQKYEQPVVTNGYQQEQWNPYSQAMEPPKVVTSFDPYQHAPHSSHDAGPPIPWNPDRRGAKRNRRTKHPVGLLVLSVMSQVWELFRRTADGNAQCQLCHVVVRSPCSSNFMGHLNRHHSEHYQNIYNRWLEGRVDIPILTS